MQVIRMAAVLAAAACVAGTAIAAEKFPQRPVRFIVPYAPGGASDFLARTLTQIALWGPIIDKAGIQAE